jgi:hypothetical protein
MDFEQFAAVDEVTNRHGLEVEGLRLAPAPRLLSVLLQLESSGSQ